ncbi:MAG: hypothetical protein FRX49_12390 [Trebouxia sp. A1-2]|nr:MAG: hypothetical protein FRX49_12390 [Trebouxia sp. A1-2]
MTGKDSHTTAAHSLPDRAVTVKILATGGVYMMNKCSSIDTAMAASNHRLLQGGSCSKLLFSLSAFRALNISTTTSTVILMVEGCLFLNRSQLKEPTALHSHHRLNLHTLTEDKELERD